MARAGGRQRSSNAARPEEESGFYVRALARGLSILALFDVEHPEWSLSDICARTGISKTTAYRMVRTLETKDFLVYDATTERYHLGSAMIPGAYLTMSYVGFVRAAHPFVERLGAVTGETVELTVGSAEGAIVVDEVATTHPFRLNRPTGRLLHSLANSSFRMHLAFRPLAEQRKIIGALLQQRTSDTITGTDEVLQRLAAERAEGIAFDLGEQDNGVCAVSAPVLERDGSLRAVLTVVAPAERFGPRLRKSKVEAVRSTAAEMTRHLGGRALNNP